MPLLFDHNLSHRLVSRLADLFPGSTHTNFLKLNRAMDFRIWEYARDHNLTIVTLDKDFAELAIVMGTPPKIIWLRCGNSSVSKVEGLLRLNFDSISNFVGREEAEVLEIWT